MHFHSPEVDILTYFFSHPAYWAGMIVLILAVAFMKTMAHHWYQTGERRKWQMVAYMAAFLLFVTSGVTVLCYKVSYLTMFWN